MATVEEIEARRAERRRRLEAEKSAQLAVDLEALDALEDEHGAEQIVRIDLDRFVPGLPTMLLFRMPTSAQMKRFQHRYADKGERRGDKVGASEQLAAACLAYPEREKYAEVLEVFTGAHMNAAATLLQAAQGRAAEEGKG